MRVRLVVGLLALGLGAVGCASRYVASADREGMAIMAEKMAVVEEFRSNLDDPRAESAESRPGRERVAPPVEVPANLTLEDAIRISTQFNRGYLAQTEGFFLQGLSLGLTRRNFHEMVFGGSLTFSGSDGSSVDFADSTVLALSGTKLLPTGGSVTISSSGSISHTKLDGSRTEDSSLSGSVSISQPLLRGAGKGIAWEGLTQAERSAVYAARSYELFRQNFVIGVINQYYGLVSQKQGLANTVAQVENQEFALKQAKALYELRRGTQQDVLRAEQSFRDSQNALLDAEQAYQVALDRFKIEMGLPIDVVFDVGEEIPEAELMEVDTESAVRAAMNNRLDLRTARDQLEDTERGLRIARNALLPGVDLTAGYSNSSDSIRDLDFGNDSVSFGLSVEIPLDRKAERNSYRAALIGMEQSRRSLRQTEDSLILEVRDAVRRLKQQEQQIRNDQENIQTLERRLLRADLDNRAGVGSNRDIVEALNALTAAQNGLLDRKVSYLVTRLSLLQQMGLLFVDKEGRIVR